MERKIKFRAWDKKAKAWLIAVEEIDARLEFNGSIGGPDIFIDATGYNHLDHASIILMQFTGLLDKNGQEICEGDILSYGPWSDGSGQCIHVVQWFEFDPGFGTYNDHEGYSSGIDTHEAEVIGNIYQNPELK